MPDQDTLAQDARKTRTGSAGWMIQRLAARLNESMRHRLAALDLKQDQFIVLMALAESPGASQTEIGARIGLANYTVTRALDALEARGLAERRPDACSRRAHRVYLTAEGRALMPEVFKVVRGLNAALLADLPDADRAGFLAGLAHLCGDGGACAD